jgi:phage gp16-like protein
MRQRDPAADRRRELAAIHAQAKKLGMARDVYESMLERVTGLRSSALLDAPGRRAVIAELVRLEGKPRERGRPAPGAPTDVAPAKRAMVAKIGALLSDAQREWNYAHSMARRMYHVQRVEWCQPDQLHRLIAALEIDRRRRASRGATT